MLRMDYDIVIGDVGLKGLESVTIESSADQLSVVCTIAVPGMAWNRSYGLEDKLKRGDAVTVKLGYDGNLKTEFVGYLKAIQPNNPLKLVCEDNAYLFRKDIKARQFKKTTSVPILQYVVDQVNSQLTTTKMKLVTDVSGIQFDTFTILPGNAFQVLEKLKAETGFNIYCRGSELHCHLPYTERRGQVRYDFSRNVEESDGLEYVSADDRKVLIRMIGRSKKGAKVQVEVGEKGGDVRTVQNPTISDKATLTRIGQQLLKKQSYDGYKGALKGWLVPYCETGYTATVVDVDYPQREGRYYVKGVKTEFSAQGGRRTVSLGIKVTV